jgi:hypothetical protein
VINHPFRVLLLEKPNLGFSKKINEKVLLKYLYSIMNGQNRKDPFVIRKDLSLNTLVVTKELSLANGADIRSDGGSISYASANVGNIDNSASVNMSSNGILNINVFGITVSLVTITIYNPFITNSSYPFQLLSRPSVDVLNSVTLFPGKAVITISPNPGNNGIWKISIGPNALPPSQYSY